MDKLYTIQEVATKLNLSDKTLRRWEEAGKITPNRTLGNQRRYSLEDLQILDAIKHGLFNEQKDLLTIEQASAMCGVSQSTLIRWEDQGKIHPFITSGNTYYIRQKLIEKLTALKTQYPEPELEPKPIVTTRSDLGSSTQLHQSAGWVKSDPQDKQGKPAATLPLAEPQKSTQSLVAMLANTAITVVILVVYHLIFNQPPTLPANPGTGSVQGASAIVTPDPRLDDLINKFQSHLQSEMLKEARPAPVTTINLDHTSYVTGTAKLPKNQTQVTITADHITPTTPVTVTFTSDFSPAKKYWVTPQKSSFTLYTDFPVSMDSLFNYSYLVATTSANLL